MLYSTNTTLVAAAVIPAVVLLIRVYRADRLEKEPRRFLVGLLLFGILSTLLALIAENVGTVVADIFFAEGSTAYNVFFYFVVVGLSEEGFKYLLLKKKTWNSPHFNCQFDGVVYAVFVSLGFALWENISYVMMYGLSTAIIRAITAVPGHACFGVFMGTWYGMAKRYHNAGEKKRSRTFRRLSLLVPMLLHGAYDYIATCCMEYSAWYFVVFILAMFFISIRLVKKLARDDRYISAG